MVVFEQATLLFKALCSRLDALSHFNFAPKPVIEDMGVRADVPALAMEEVCIFEFPESASLGDQISFDTMSFFRASDPV